MKAIYQAGEDDVMAEDSEATRTTQSLALYRKYRPATFAEVLGQDHVTEPLRQALRSGRINHAYLFSGPRGCGKTSSARILARSLNCVNGPTPDPCGVHLANPPRAGRQQGYAGADGCAGGPFPFR